MTRRTDKQPSFVRLGLLIALTLCVCFCFVNRAARAGGCEPGVVWNPDSELKFYSLISTGEDALPLSTMKSILNVPMYSDIFAQLNRPMRVSQEWILIQDIPTQLISGQGFKITFVLKMSPEVDLLYSESADRKHAYDTTGKWKVYEYSAGVDFFTEVMQSYYILPEQKTDDNEVVSLEHIVGELRAKLGSQLKFFTPLKNTSEESITFLTIRTGDNICRHAILNQGDPVDINLQPVTEDSNLDGMIDSIRAISLRSVVPGFPN